MNAFGKVALPPGVVTVTFTAPVVPAGEVHVIWVSLKTVTFVAGLGPKVTLVVPVKLVPVMVTDVPPLTEPEIVERDVIIGGGGIYFALMVQLYVLCNIL